MAVKKKKSSGRKSVEVELWDVVLSYPDVADPKPYKGKTYYRTDALIEAKSQNLQNLKNAIHDVCVAAFGDDEEEWPVDNIVKIGKGSDREDNPEYHGKYYITPKTQTPIEHNILDMKGKVLNPKSVRGGQTANVFITVKAWEFDGDEGVAIYLDGLQVDTSKAVADGFGGGKSLKSRMKRVADDEESEDQDDSDDSDDEEEDEKPVKKSKKPPVDEDEDDSDDEDEKPVKKKKKASRDFDDEDE